MYITRWAFRRPEIQRSHPIRVRLRVRVRDKVRDRVRDMVSVRARIRFRVEVTVSVRPGPQRRHPHRRRSARWSSRPVQ